MSDDDTKAHQYPCRIAAGGISENMLGAQRLNSPKTQIAVSPGFVSVANILVKKFRIKRVAFIAGAPKSFPGWHVAIERTFIDGRETAVETATAAAIR